MTEHKNHQDAPRAHKPRKGYRVAFLLAFSAGLLAEKAIRKAFELLKQ